MGAAMDSGGVTVEVIADGVHLHPATVRMLVRSFGPERVCLVTDAVRPAGLESGTFRVGGHDAVLDGGSVRLPDGTIAGSAATMNGILRNLVDWAVAPLTEAVRMASTTPAQRLGLGEAKGVIAPGYDADIIALDGDLNVAATWVRGERVYEGGDIIPPQEASE
jgi:N-acetylglucosamine-6-phosphate deacetylase